MGGDLDSKRLNTEKTSVLKRLTEIFTFHGKSSKNGFNHDLAGVSYRELFENLPEVIFQVDKEMKIIWANKSALGRKPDAIGSECFLMCNGYGERTGNCYCRRALSEGNFQKDMIYHPDINSIYGNNYWEGTSIPIKDKHGNITGAVIIARDITEFVKYLKSPLVIQSVVDSIKEISININFEGIIKTWNNYAKSLTGFTAREAVGNSILILLKDESIIFLNRLVSKIRNDETIEKIPVKLYSKNNNVLHVLLTAYPELSSGGVVQTIIIKLQDISQINEAKDDIVATENFYSSIIDGMGIGIAVIDSNKNIKSWNKLMAGMTGEKSELVIGKNINDILPDFKRAGFDDIVEIVKTGETVEFSNKWLVVLKGTKELFVNGAMTPQISPTGSISGFVWTIIDYTKRKFEEEASKKIYETLNALIKSSPEAIMILDKAGNVMVWNPACHRLFGWTEDEALHKINPFINTGKFGDFSEIFAKAVDGQSFNDLEIESKRKDGSIIDVSLSVSPLQNEVGDVIGIISILTDVSLRHNTEAALRESEDRYMSFVHNFKGIAYRWRLDYKPVFLHGSIDEITGFSEDEFINGTVDWVEIIFPEDLNMFLEQSRLVGSKVENESDIEYRIIAKDKQIRWVQNHLQNVVNEKGEPVYIQGTIYNITGRKEAEGELRRSREQLRNLALHVESTREEEKKHIAFEIHDELGHALTALKLEIGWLQKKRFLRQEVLYERLRKMSEMIDSTIRKVRSISSNLRPSVLDHFGLVAALEWQAVEFQKSTAIRCKLNIQMEEIKLDEARATAIFRIFQEILTNVARHAHATRVDVLLEKTDTDIRLRVSDNGKGVKQEQINNRKSFGLIGMNERANALGGKLSISGVINIGTTVNLNIPISQKES